MASTVASPLELQFGEIPGLTQMTSSSALGYVQVTLQFELSRPIDGAVADTLAAINPAAAYLPKNMPYPPLIRQGNPAHPPLQRPHLPPPTPPPPLCPPHPPSIPTPPHPP